jgi:DNA-binding NtrC family response regulator
LRGNETILVVEDQDQLLKIACDVLRSYGYRVLEAADPAAALVHCEQHIGEIDLLLTDVVMPQMMGPELAGRLKLVRPEMQVVFMSGYSERVVADPRQLAGAYLPKPFSPLTLAQTVRATLGVAPVTGTILIVDDEPGVRKLLRSLLTAAHYTVLEAETGKDAVHQVATLEIDLAITDLAMPDQEGFETMKAMRRARPQLKIIAISGRFAGTMLRAAEFLGAQASIAKPIHPDELLVTVARVLAG